MITEQWVRTKCVNCATIITVADGARDGANQPTETLTETRVDCAWWMDRGDETTAGRQIATTHMTMVFPGCPSITATSRVRLGTVTYELVSPPVQWPSPRTGATIATQVWLERTS